AVRRHGARRGAAAQIRQSLEESYRRRFAFLMPHQSLVIESVSVECIAPGVAMAGAAAPGVAPAVAALANAYREAEAMVSVYCLADDEPAGRRAARLYRVEALRAGAEVDGPAILAERNATTVVEPGWRASVTAAGCLELRRVRARSARHAAGTQVDPGRLRPFNK